jgi:hypothetical protein
VDEREEQLTNSSTRLERSRLKYERLAKLLIRCAARALLEMITFMPAAKASMRHAVLRRASSICRISSSA